MFIDLKRDHGVRSYLAHNMTVTPSNLPEVAETVRAVLDMRFDMMSFQPAAFIGDDRRWKEDFSAVSIDAVWAQVEAGAGQSLPWRATQFGHPSCNRYTTGVLVDGRFTVALDPDDARDIAARDILLANVGGMVFGGTPWLVLMVKIVRAAVLHPGDVGVAVAQLGRIVTRAGGPRRVIRAAVRRRVSVRTFVVHSFMDTAQVAPAWALLQDGVMSDDLSVRETQVRLQSCSYAMSHPADGRLVSACVQHSTAMVRPGREVLNGRVEVDETFIGGEEPGPRGRGTLGKTLVVIAVELREPRGYGRARMRACPTPRPRPCARS